MMYDNEGYIKNNKTVVERRLLTTIKDEVWNKITDLMVKDGDQITHQSVNKRLRKAIANRENGKKGGRPRKQDLEDDLEDELNEKKPKKPNLETQEETQNNPPYKEKEKEKEKIKEKGGIGDKSPPTPLPSVDKVEERKKREKKFYQSLVPFVGSFSKEMLRNFFEYWSEPNKSGTKMKWEMEKTWDLERRLSKWQSNDDRWSKTFKESANESKQSISEDPELAAQRAAARGKTASQQS